MGLNYPVTRRRFLQAAAATGILGTAGCNSNMTDPTTTPTSTSAPTQTSVSRSTGSPAEPTPANPDTIFVDAENGAKGASGSKDDPMRSLQTAMERAKPGETVYAMPGEYREVVLSRRHGEPDAPITLTGPKEAVLRNHPDEYYTLRIRHSHVHVTGLTIDGLHDPSRPDDPRSYAPGVVQVRPLFSNDEYLQDIVVTPHAIGNGYKALVQVTRTIGAEIGAFRVIGPAGAIYTVGDTREHNGEIVYLGTALGNLGKEFHPWENPDRTRDIHVHHIDNSAGHPHSELVNTKEGVSDVLIEYCSDLGGSFNTTDDPEEPGPQPSAAIRLQGQDTTVRWCDLQNGTGHGIAIQGWIQDRGLTTEQKAMVEDYGENNSIYRNRILDNGNQAISIRLPEEKTQKIICGNEYNGETHGDPDTSCPGDIPKGDGIGHTAGDSPWA